MSSELLSHWVQTGDIWQGKRGGDLEAENTKGERQRGIKQRAEYTEQGRDRAGERGARHRGKEIERKRLRDRGTRWKKGKGETESKTQRKKDIEGEKMEEES